MLFFLDNLQIYQMCEYLYYKNHNSAKSGIY